MSYNVKKIHIGKLIHQKVNEKGIDMYRIEKFLKCSEEEIFSMYQKPSIDTEILLRWSKLLKYDFFRIYVQHIILFSPSEKSKTEEQETQKLPSYRKNVYTKEIINFVLELLNSGLKTKTEITEKYKIPKTTLYKWIEKYNSRNSE
ncbi:MULTISPECIES: recombinase family protein [unclassified Chryseobacterium]|uniref:recombinase family protein n=1 Tax=unclassified Chryseobacterium TaxID=2593645 RepID=UPI000D34A116|nr:MULTISPECIES: recombinase family protein [unclassified Chryseobacterium]PTT70339.1 transposase [Chryseobacterium sp. HMWF001]PVV56190.1 recombinase family protein [Chryseobacterium sp. HMWF035]